MFFTVESLWGCPPPQIHKTLSPGNSFCSKFSHFSGRKLGVGQLFLFFAMNQRWAGDEPVIIGYHSSRPSTHTQVFASRFCAGQGIARWQAELPMGLALGKNYTQAHLHWLFGEQEQQ